MYTFCVLGLCLFPINIYLFLLIKKKKKILAMEYKAGTRAIWSRYVEEYLERLGEVLCASWI